MSFLGGLIGPALSLFGANQAASAQRRALEPQRKIANQQLALFRQASPYYAQILQYLSQNAGLGAPGAGVPGAGGAGAGQPGMGFSQPSTQHPAPSTGSPAAIPQSALGIYGSNPADAYRFQQAQEQIDQARRMQAQRLSYQLGQQGAGSNTIASVLGRNEQGAQDQLARFRQGLAINAGTEQQNRVQQLLAALGAGFGQGGQAAGIYGSQAALAGNQLGQATQGIGSALETMQLWKILMQQRKQQPGITGAEADPLDLMRLLYSTRPGAGPFG